MESFCRDLQEVSLGILQEKFGKKTGEMLFNTCRGIDHSKLCTEHVRKSVSAEVNYGIRFECDNDARVFLTKLGKEVCSRLVKANAKGRCVTLKLMVRAKNAPVDPAKFMGHGLCDNFTKSKNFMTPVDDEGIITKDVLGLWEQMQQPAHEIRGIGIQISRLESLRSKVATNNLMKFIAKGKTVEDNQKTQGNIGNSDFGVRNIINNETLGKIENSNSGVGNCIHEARKDVEVKKPRDLRAFFAVKKSSVDNLKEKSSYVDKKSKIDESVLAELPEDIRREILNHEADLKNASTSENPEKINIPNVEPENPPNDSYHSSSQGIDEDVLTELPEEIRNEILASKPKIKKSQAPVMNNYFKHKKPGTTFSQSKMPTMQELDMKVLIELPDSIRNEILNEYRMQNNEESNPETSNANVIPKEPKESSKSKNEDLNSSFSQVDPDFLASLDTETRKDVERYYLSKKVEKSKLKKVVNEKPSNDVNPKKRGRKPKALALIQTNKNVSAQTNKNVLAQTNKNAKTPRNIDKKSGQKCETEVLPRNNSFLHHEMSILEDEPIGNNRYENRSRSDLRDNVKVVIEETTPHQKMLNTLVNYLFSLPIQQVKRQIQAWINNSDKVNEIDTLSIRTYLSLLPKEKRIEDLHTLMKTMHR